MSTSLALELKEDYLKAYARRAQAHEAMEKYEDALESTIELVYQLMLM